jgi:hypothetical protein
MSPDVSEEHGASIFRAEVCLQILYEILFVLKSDMVMSQTSVTMFLKE